MGVCFVIVYWAVHILCTSLYELYLTIDTKGKWKKQIEWKDHVCSFRKRYNTVTVLLILKLQIGHWFKNVRYSCFNLWHSSVTQKPLLQWRVSCFHWFKAVFKWVPHFQKLVSSQGVKRVTTFFQTVPTWSLRKEALVWTGYLGLSPSGWGGCWFWISMAGLRPPAMLTLKSSKVICK